MIHSCLLLSILGSICVLSLLLFKFYLLQYWSSTSKGTTRVRKPHRSVVCKRPPSSLGPESGTDCVRRAIWGMLNAGDACCVVSQSVRGLVKIMVVMVAGLRPLTVYDETNTLSVPPPCASSTMMGVEGSGQRYKEIQPFPYLKGAISSGHIP